MPKPSTRYGNRDALGACRMPVAIPVRGAPRGNRNAFKHGGASARAKAKRAELRVLRAEAQEAAAFARCLVAALQTGDSDAIRALAANRACEGSSNICGAVASRTKKALSIQ